MEKVSLKNSIDFTSVVPILFCINWTSHLIQRVIAKIWQNYKTCRKSEKFSRNIDRNFSVLTDSLIGDTSLYYRQELSVALSIGIKSSYAIYFWRPYFWEANFTSNWLCSKLLVTYPDRGGQAKHFWHFLFLLSFLSQLSSVQLRDISAKFYINIFYSPWPPLSDKTLKKICMSSYYTSAPGSTVNVNKKQIENSGKKEWGWSRQGI